MSATPFADLNALAAHLRQELENKRFILLYAYNGTGKTRLSTAFKDLGKQEDARDTLYFNAFTEDLFFWDNDLNNDRERVLKINRDSRFFAGLEELEMDNRIRPLLNRYADFDFKIDTEDWEVSFSREILNGDRLETVDDIKISRGEENVFIWCFFLAILQLVLDKAEAYKWVKYIYIDDPISSVDEHNAIVVANHLVQLFRDTPNQLKTVISTHHVLFFNVLSNEIKNLLSTRDFPQYFLSRSRKSADYLLFRQKSDTPFFHHVAALVQLYEAAQSENIYTHHFNTLRSILEKTAVFHGYGHFSSCIKKDANDADGILYQRFVDLLSHGKYSLYEPQEMGDETKSYFQKILNEFLVRYPFNPALFPSKPEKAPTS
jgi:energy-coupling factor transporter ATP-binding protein EcfA2